MKLSILIPEWICKRLILGIWVLMCLVLYPSICLAQSHTLPEIIVTSPQFPIPLTERSQHIDVIEAEELERLAVRSVDEALRLISGVDVSQRGPFGVQADISLRGAGFEQTLFLINGMRINDPQTGHFHSDLPISLSDIERIEVMPGGASAIYGAGGFGGVINIVTKTMQPKGLRAGLTIGEHNYKNWSAGLISPVYKDTQIGLSINDQRSDGYRPNTDFHNTTYSIYLNSDKWQVFGGFLEKRFGANGFYTLRFPAQWEHTQTGVISLKANSKISNASFEPSLIYRHHYDYYVLDRYNHAFYQNTHRTNSLTLRLPVGFTSGESRYIAGLEVSYDNIDSTRLGEHSRNSKALFAGLSRPIGKARIDLDLRTDHYSGGIGLEFSPSVGISYTIEENLKVRASANRSFRLPSYTELYYKSPTSVGNPDLQPEKAWQIEGGVDYYGNNYIAGITVFRRWGRDIIDWFNRGNYWQSENISKVNTYGITLNLNFVFGRHTIKLDYSGIDQNSDGGTNAYYMNYLRHKVNLTILSTLPYDFTSSLTVGHQKRINQSAFTLANAKLTKSLKMGPAKTRIFIEGKNLFNTQYQDLAGLPLPGRWLFMGIEVGI